MANEDLIYAIDIGDSVVRAGVYHRGRTMLIGSAPTPREPGVDTIDSVLWPLIAKMVRKLQAMHPGGGGLAVSASGTMTLTRSDRTRDYGPFRNQEVIAFAPSVDALKNAPILSCLERLQLGLPLHVENDMNAALISATQFDDAVLIGLGAGLGGAIKKGGVIQHLPGTWSCFEIGHGRRWDLGRDHVRKCHCGSIGCLEAAIGGWAMTERYVIAPEDAAPAVYSRMRHDVVQLLPQAIAKLVNASRIPTVLMGGKGSLGYSMGSDFMTKLCIATQELVDDVEIKIQLVDLGEAAELHGSALAFLQLVGARELTAEERTTTARVVVS